MSAFLPCSTELFFKSTKAGDLRLGSQVQTQLPQEPSFVLAGYPDDEGIRINGGRTGAAKAPDVIRKYFYKMTPSFYKKQQPLLWDHGNLKTSPSLLERHELVKTEITNTLQQSHRWIGLGGGHDYGYADGAGFLGAQKKTALKPLIINFDAHLDVRPVEGTPSSGTPFYRLLTAPELPAFDFIEIGLQPQCNSPAHVQWAREKGAQLLFFEELLCEGHFLNTTLNKLAPSLLQKRPTYLSVDIDAFSSAYAPGCSQSWSTGLIANEFFLLFNILLQRLDVQVLGIYEVSPALDQDDRTSKLAAQIIYNYVQHEHTF